MLDGTNCLTLGWLSLKIYVEKRNNRKLTNMQYTTLKKKFEHKTDIFYYHGNIVFHKNRLTELRSSPKVKHNFTQLLIKLNN